MTKKSKQGRKRKAVPDLARRQRALEATMKRFAGQPLDLGQSDCVQLVRYHLVKMGRRGLPKPPAYDTPTGALRALKAQGADTLEQLLDKHLKRIAPAAMLPGDVALIMPEPGAPAAEIGTIVVSVGRKFLGWHPDEVLFAIMDPRVDAPFIAAWRA